MAWPCISRVCCLARFWNQLDKSDLSVPLTLHNYSDIEGPAEGGPAEGGPARRPDPAAAAPGRSRRGRGSPAAPDPPFAAETQYRRDFGGWTPLPHSAPPGAARDCRRLGLPAAAHAHAPPPPPGPAAAAVAASSASSSSSSSSSAGLGVYVVAAGDPPAVGTTSYRQEYRPWTGVKPSKPIKTKQTSVLAIDNTVRETSYRADFKVPEGKTKFSPNPSAVFQAPARILNV